MGVKFRLFLFETVLSNLDTIGIHKGQAALMYPRKLKLFIIMFDASCYEYL
jgi:hypothetical protein